MQFIEVIAVHMQTNHARMSLNWFLSFVLVWRLFLFVRVYNCDRQRPNVTTEQTFTKVLE